MQSARARRLARASLDNSRPNLRAVGYLRVSTEDQVKGHGLAYTEREVKAYAARRQWSYLETYSDEGVSGTLPAEERPDLARLMRRARQPDPGFDVVMVVEGRQIGREGRACWPWVWELEDRGIFTAITSLGIDNTTEYGRDAMRQEQDYAEREWSRLRRRLQGGIQEAAEMGGYPGGRCPFGWEVVGTPKGEFSRFRVSDPAARTIRQAAELYKRLREWSATAAGLNAERMLSPFGLPWTGVNLKQRLVGQAIQTNTITWRGRQAARGHDGEPLFGRQVTIRLPQLLTAEEAAVFLLPPRRARPGPSSPRRYYILTGIFTALCGASYSGKPATNGHRTYVCRGRMHPERGAQCSCRPLRADEVEQRVWDKVSGLLGSPERMEEMARRHLAQASEVDYNSRLAELDQRIADQSAALAASMGVAAKLATGRGLTGEAAEAAIEAALGPLQKELTELEGHRSQVAAWRNEQERAESGVASVVAMAERFRGRLNGLSATARAEVLQLVGARVAVTGTAPEARGKPCALWEWFASRELDVPILTDESWSAARPIIVRGRRTEERGRQLLGAMLHKAQHGSTWAQVAPLYGSTANDLQVSTSRLLRGGVWGRLMESLADAPAAPQVLAQAPLSVQLSPLTADDTRSEVGIRNGTERFPLLTSSVTFTLSA